jgi:hypothetical protein
MRIKILHKQGKSLRAVMLICLVTSCRSPPDNPTGGKRREATGQHELQF